MEVLKLLTICIVLNNMINELRYEFNIFSKYKWISFIINKVCCLKCFTFWVGLPTIGLFKSSLTVLMILIYYKIKEIYDDRKGRRTKI